MEQVLIDKVTLLITQALALVAIVCAICGLVATALPQQWKFTVLLTKIGMLTVRATTKPGAKALPTGAGSTLLFAALSTVVISGCAGTFEEARIARRSARTSAPPMSASSPERCQSLSEREYWFTGTGLGLVAVGAAAASLALPVENKTVETILIAGGTTATVTGGGLTWFGTAAGVNYVREGCPK